MDCDYKKISTVSCIHVVNHLLKQCTHLLLYMYMYQLKWSDSPLHLALEKGHIACVEHLLSTPGIEVNTKNNVSCLFHVMFLYVQTHVPYRYIYLHCACANQICISSCKYCNV